MRIVAVNERTIPLSAASRNASISFDAMTASAIAIVTDASDGGKPLTGIGFDSVGRYGHGALLRERFIPRLLAADPDDYADGDGGIDPEKVWAVAMRNEKPGGHGERSGAIGLIDAAAFDLAAKRKGLPLWAYLRGAIPAAGRERHRYLRQRRALSHGRRHRPPARRHPQGDCARASPLQDQDRRHRSGRGYSAHRGGAVDARGRHDACR